MGRRRDVIALVSKITGSLAGGSRRHPQSFVLILDARVAANGCNASRRMDVEIALSRFPYPCPNYPKSKPPAAASSRTSSAAASRRLLVHDRRLRWPVDPTLVAAVAGTAIRRAGRRAKYLLIETDAGTLILHLGMSGSLRVLPAATPRIAHDHVDIELDSGQTLRFNDPRRFGSLLFTARRSGSCIRCSGISRRNRSKTASTASISGRSRGAARSRSSSSS